MKISDSQQHQQDIKVSESQQQQQHVKILDSQQPPQQLLQQQPPQSQPQSQPQQPQQQAVPSQQALGIDLPDLPLAKKARKIAPKPKTRGPPAAKPAP